MSDETKTPEMIFGLMAESPSDPSERIPIRQTEAGASQPRRPTYNLEDLNLPSPKKKTVSTFIGTFRSCNTIDRWEWTYLAVSLISLVASFGITIERIVTLYDDIQDPEEKDSSKADFTFALLLAWTTLFCFYHVITGIMCERFYDLVVFAGTIAIVLIYVVMNFLVSPEKSDSKLARLILTVVVSPILIAGGCKIAYRYYVSGNLVYNTVGANSAMQKICKNVYLCDSLIKLDIQLGGSTLILWLQKSFIDNEVDVVEIAVVGVGIIETIAWATIGFLAIRYEKTALVYLFYATSVIEPATIIVNLYRTISDQGVRSLVYSTYACGIAALIIRVWALYSMWAVCNNFGKGLRQKIFGDSPPQAAETGSSEIKEDETAG